MNIIKQEVNTFLTALMFFSRIPCPKHIDHSVEILADSRKYFPLVGSLVGVITLFVFVLLNYLTTPIVAILVSTFASIIITGAFHEDGLADFVDGFGGGWTKDQILAIMKDSRLGTYGAVSLFIMILLKVFFLYEIEKFNYIYPTLIISHSVSRYVASTIVQMMDYVQEDKISKSKPIASQKFSKMKHFISFTPVLIMILFFPKSFFSVIFSFLPLLFMTPLLSKKIGGYTGDCLGACQQISEICYYFAMVVSWKFL